ncbi:MAG: leucyl aminopeptidase [Euryarchaeota archaeon]|jgi:leucyl aminopeptidase|nr:leucyl aminopeptidase [Euryarchaeota archaeon]MBT6640051.1 leucyl aminopeptidase [Euryarchaeota archaeon]MBT7063273.1 leucyl aminopeptidase [Euryarchaeota archaeon]MBT7263594.1 leucyl aminopeptidase [Euryarchaeota archaeon]MBT7638174.1 leucyl aminopeptidase [Euryarchaeota archaeon]
MKVSVSPGHNINGTLILPLFEGSEAVPESLEAGLHNSLKGQINRILDDGDFKAKLKSTMSIIGGEGGKAMLVGLGKEADCDIHAYRKAGAAVIANRKKAHGTELTARFSTASIEEMGAFAEGMLLRDYSYDHYKQQDKDDEEADIDVRINCNDEQEAGLSPLIKIHAGVASGVHLSRDLGNCPPNDMYPEAFADQAWEWAKQFDNVEVTIINYAQAVKAGMGGLVAVGMGSERKPCMVIFELNRDKKGRGPMLVGKGITFDTGGISLKPGANMDEMKYDMGGSATVFGTMQALASTGYSGKVSAITCMAENMPSSNAQRPGDVIKTLSGKTIEVLNTDAEGRLVLSDGLWKAGEFDPEYIIDFATLTGACVVALGHEATGLWSNDDDFRTRIHEAGNAVDELAWPMPLLPAFEKEMTDSKIADTRNLGAGRWGGANTAAAFLKQFVPNRNYEKDGEQIPWAHMDIAGTYWGAKTNSMVGHGATGIHVRTIYHLITQG